MNGMNLDSPYFSALDEMGRGVQELGGVVRSSSTGKKSRGNDVYISEYILDRVVFSFPSIRFPRNELVALACLHVVTIDFFFGGKAISDDLAWRGEKTDRSCLSVFVFVFVEFVIATA